MCLLFKLKKKKIIVSIPNIKKFYIFVFHMKWDLSKLHDSHRQTCFYEQYNGKKFKGE